MGLENNSSVIYLSIGEGRITKRVKEPTANSVTRTTKEGKTVHEEIHKALSGYIKDVKVTKHEQYGKFWNIVVEDDGETYVLQMNYSGGYASSFLKALPNVDLRQKVKLVPYIKTVNDKKRTSLYINQNDDTVQWFFTKEDPKGLPQMVQVKVKGELTWDDSDMMEFLEKYVEDNIKPKLSKTVRIDENEPAAINQDQEDGDLPF